MSTYPEEEVEAAFRAFWRVGAVEEKWSEWPEYFTEDVTYIEHVYGTMYGREAVRAWIEELMGGNSDIHAVLDWYIIDGSRIVLNMQNRYYNPDPEGEELYFDFPGITVLEYAGDGKFSSEEDYWDVRLAKEAYQKFQAGLEQHGRTHIEETEERMRARDPWLG